MILSASSAWQAKITRSNSTVLPVSSVNVTPPVCAFAFLTPHLSFILCLKPALRRLTYSRLAPLTVGKFAAAGAYLFCLLHPSAWSITATFAVVAFSTDLGSAGGWAYKQDVGGRHVASIHGWANMWGNLGAAVTPPLLIWIVGEGERWDLAFLACATAFLIAGFCGLGINATIPILPEDEPILAEETSD